MCLSGWSLKCEKSGLEAVPDNQLHQLLFVHDQFVIKQKERNANYMYNILINECKK